MSDRILHYLAAIKLNEHFSDSIHKSSHKDSCCHNYGLVRKIWVKYTSPLLLDATPIPVKL